MSIDLYTGPWYGPSNKQGHKVYAGPAAIALKRIVSRARTDIFPWQAFDSLYNRKLEQAIANIQRAHGIVGTGQTGEPTFRLLMKLRRQGYPKELAADNVAINLLEDAWQKLHPPKTPLQKVQEGLAGFLLEMEAYAGSWHYRQARPMNSLGRAPRSGGYSDCSELATAAPYFMRKLSGVYTPDPNGRGYDGYGNTDSLYAHNKTRKVSGVYQIGDLAIYGPVGSTRHVTICRQLGTSTTAVFTSNGSEAGPLPTRVNYRGDLLAVVRPQLLP